MNDIQKRIAVVTAAENLNATAQQLAQRLDLPCTTSDSTDYAFLLEFVALDDASGQRLQLRHTAESSGPIYVEFVHGKAGYRRTHDGRRQPLARAVGLKHGVTPTVLDATAGLGRDAFVLASLGCSVHLIERSPIVAALLMDGLERARADAQTAPIAARMRITCADARDALRTLGERPEVVYLDPMYPHRKKSALVKKEMRLLREVLGDDIDAAEILPAALAVAARRVVVKRPGGAPTLDARPVAYTIESENTRFDVYLAPAMNSASII